MAKFASYLVLGLLAVTQAEKPSGPNDITGCIMSNTGAVNAMVDSALFIYVTNRNCKNFVEDAGVCVKDLASVVNSVMGVLEFLVKVFKTCGEIKTTNYDCAIAGTQLTGSLAAITANTAAATMDCPVVPPKIGGNTPWTYAGADTCNVFIGGAMSSLQAAITSMMNVKGKCGKEHGSGEKCFAGSLDIISAIANLATSLENLASKCSHGKINFANGCEADIAGVIGALASTTSASVKIKDSCTPKKTRLYQEGQWSEPATFVPPNLMTAMLLVFLPITGFASFYGGARFSKGRGTRTTRRIPTGADTDLE